MSWQRFFRRAYLCPDHMKKASKSAGVRHPVRNAVLSGLLTVAGVVLVLLGAADMRATGRSGSPLLALGLFPAILSPIAFVYYLGKGRVVRDLRDGRTAIARWTVPAEQFRRFADEDLRIPAWSMETNFYRPPDTIPAEGVEVIFSDSGVLIGGGYFPLSVTGGRRVQRVRYVDADPPSIEFGTVLRGLARTSSATVATTRTAETLRVPVAAGATRQAREVVQRYQALLARR